MAASNVPVLFSILPRELIPSVPLLARRAMAAVGPSRKTPADHLLPGSSLGGQVLHFGDGLFS
jgi:hypothetical protein